jgi:hypothetical protein
MTDIATAILEQATQELDRLFGQGGVRETQPLLARPALAY